METAIAKLLTEARRRRSLPPPAIRRLLRQRAGLTQHEIAGLLGVGRPTVTRYESGARAPRGTVRLAYVDLLEGLADAPENDEAPAGNGRQVTTSVDHGDGHARR